MQHHDLERASGSVLRTPGVFDVDVPDGWQQGRGAFGGLTIAAMIRAIEAFSATPGRPLRSLTAELPGATMAGGAEIRVEPVRVGSGQSTISARLVQEGEIRACATAILASPRAADAETFCELEAPPLRPWRELEPLPMGPGFPVFAQHFEYRTEGPFPFTGGPSALTLGWIRARNADRSAMGDAAWLAAHLDAWWPATFSRSTTMRPIATVAFTMQIVGSVDDLDPAAPLAYRGHAWVQAGGFFVEQRELWSPEGRPLALNQQTFAIVK